MTVLFIDDDSEDTDLFCEAVAFINRSELLPADKGTIECLSANDGCQAIEIIPTLELPPDYIFLDINMPIMGGRECLKYLKSNPAYARIPVIMFSTTCSQKDVIEFKALGAIDCIKKPYAFKELVKILSRYIFAEYL